MASTLRKFLEMIRFSHTIFALPFALTAAALAWHGRTTPPLAVEWVGLIACMVFARSAAMAFNRVVDRDIDARNPRTATRHLPAGTLSVTAVVGFLVGSAALFIASAGLFLLATPPNPWPLLLSVPVLLFVLAYSLTKRFTSLAHVWLGASLMLAPLAAWIALRGLDNLLVPVMLGLAVLAWVTGFDILYACQDADFDRTAGLHSIPAWLGVPTALRVAAACHVVMVLCLLLLWWVARPVLGTIYLLGVAGAAGLLIYEHALVRPNDLGRVNQAFFHVNGVISVGLLVVVLVQLAVG